LARRITPIIPEEKIWPGRDGGPFSVRDGEDNYQLYLIRPASNSQSDFINLLFDRPLLLLIVTMLVSSPLLLWLAWSLAKPARKLKNAADEVAQGNLRQHPELEAGPQEFLAAGTSFNQMVSALERMMTAQQRCCRISRTSCAPRSRDCSLAPRCCVAAAVKAKSWSVSKRKRTVWTA
jgi:HAMP domain-containing protein